MIHGRVCDAINISSTSYSMYGSVCGSSDNVRVSRVFLRPIGTLCSETYTSLVPDGSGRLTIATVGVCFGGGSVLD